MQEHSHHSAHTGARHHKASWLGNTKRLMVLVGILSVASMALSLIALDSYKPKPQQGDAAFFGNPRTQFYQSFNKTPQPPQPPPDLGDLVVSLKSASGVNTASDSSPYGYSGTFHNGATYKDLLFDGVNDYIDIPEKPQMVYMGGALTLAAWVYVDPNITTGAALFFKPYTSSGQYNYDFFVDQTGRLQFQLQAGASNAVTARTTGVFPKAAWHHVAAVAESSGISIYIDGKKAAETSIPSGMVFGNSADQHLPLVIGGVYPYGDGWSGASNASVSTMKGRMDDVLVYKKALSASEISALFQAGH